MLQSTQLFERREIKRHSARTSFALNKMIVLLYAQAYIKSTFKQKTLKSYLRQQRSKIIAITINKQILLIIIALLAPSESPSFSLPLFAEIFIS